MIASPRISIARTTAGLPISFASAARRSHLLGRAVVGNATRRVRLQERVAQRAEEVVGDAAHVVPRGDEIVHTDERARDVFGGRGLEHREPLLERRAAERRLHLLRVELPAADGERLVEQRERIARRATRRAGR